MEKSEFRVVVNDIDGRGRVMFMAIWRGRVVAEQGFYLEALPRYISLERLTRISEKQKAYWMSNPHHWWDKESAKEFMAAS